MPRPIHVVSPADEEEWLRTLQHSVWPVIAQINGEWQPPGTGFHVGKEGLLVTAKHVLEPAVKKRGRILNTAGKWVDEGFFYAVGPSADRPQIPDTPYLLPVAVSHLPDLGDIALCQLRVPNSAAVRASIRSLALSPGIPKIGERVFVFGYHKFEVGESEPSENNVHIHFDAEAFISRGTITAVHVPKRDPVMAPFPCFTIDALIHAGMSGAPVFNEAGYVIGIVSLSPSWDNTATCALIGMAMGSTIDMLTSDGCTREPILLYDLIKAGRVASDESIDLVILERSAESVQVSMMPAPSASTLR